MFESREPERGIRCSVFEHELCHHLSERGTMLESVARSSANDPYIRVFRMPVDDEILISRILVLADTCLQQRRIFHPRKTVRHILTDSSQPLFADQALT